ncbi:hypothetical protein BGX21_001725, partial [Mortierella sp. AD011]
MPPTIEKEYNLEKRVMELLRLGIFDSILIRDHSLLKPGALPGVARIIADQIGGFNLKTKCTSRFFQAGM